MEQDLLKAWEDHQWPSANHLEMSASCWAYQPGTGKWVLWPPAKGRNSEGVGLGNHVNRHHPFADPQHGRCHCFQGLGVTDLHPKSDKLDMCI